MALRLGPHPPLVPRPNPSVCHIAKLNGHSKSVCRNPDLAVPGGTMKSGSQLVFTAILSCLALGTPVICSASPLPNQTGLATSATPSSSSPVYYGSPNPADNTYSIGLTSNADK